MRTILPISAVALGLLLLFQVPAAAQRGPGFGRILSRMPLSIGVTYAYSDPSFLHQVEGRLRFTREWGVLPGRSPFSHVTVIDVAVGGRFARGDSTEVRWRAALLDADFSRRWTTFGFTLIDLDRQGLLEEDFRWANLRVGLGRAVGSRQFALFPEVRGSAGVGRWKVGLVHYPALGLDEQRKLKGLEVSYLARLTLTAARRLMLSAGYGERVLVDAPEPHLKTFRLEGSLRSGRPGKSFLRLTFYYLRERSNLNDRPGEQVNKRFGAGLLLTLMRRPRPVPSDIFE